MGRATQRSIKILELIAEGDRGRTHAEISRKLDIPKSTLTDLLRDLIARDYLEIDPAGEYSIGPRVMILARSYLTRLDVVSRSRDILQRLCQGVDEASSIAVRHDLEIVVVAQERPVKPLVAAMILGDRAPMIATATGKAIMAYMDDKSVIEIIKRSAKENLNPLRPLSEAALQAELASVRAGGLAKNIQEWMEGVSSIALPILTPEGPIASIAVAAPAGRMTKSWLAAVEPQLKQAAQELTLRMGGSAPALIAKTTGPGKRLTVRERVSK